MVSLCNPSRRRLPTRCWALAEVTARPRRHRFDGRCPVRRSGPTRRDIRRARRRIRRPALLRWRGLGTSSPVDRTARWRDTHVDPDDRTRAGRYPIGTVHLAGERHVPPATVTAHRGGHDPGAAGVDTAGELARRLVRGQPAEPRQSDVPPVGFDADRAGGEPDGGDRPAAGLEPGKANRATGAFPRTGIRPVPQPAREPVQTGVIRLFGALRPTTAPPHLWRRSTSGAARAATRPMPGVRSASATP